MVYEDDAIIVINKPAGLVVHPAAGHASGTLVNALIAHCGASLSGIGGVKRPGIVHRLDKDTTGILIAAKTDKAHKSLTKQFADHGRTGALRRAYVALVWGAPKLPSGRIDLPIDRHRTAREKMAVRQGGREAITHWQVLERFQAEGGEAIASALSCELETGRTHQIRVHLAHAGHPLLGDDVYGSGFKTKASRLNAKARELLAEPAPPGAARGASHHRASRHGRGDVVRCGLAGGHGEAGRGAEGLRQDRAPRFDRGQGSPPRVGLKRLVKETRGARSSARPSRNLSSGHAGSV